ncbi:UNVERIFIED_CONTAM: Retrovirus-related Pol polyprotein from transposon gypsy [Sesamum calycinum]|uniref:Retrovirus-related Pol polyprotein from transposon gypsy n=1 Tax=Sesamum calycinum TaxID=2727403 RepID=A0AAW2MCN2_9LAMI
MSHNALVKGVINTIARRPARGDPGRARKRYKRTSKQRKWAMNVESEEKITFGRKDRRSETGSIYDSMVITMDIANFLVHKILMDNGSFANIIFWEVISRMGLDDVVWNLEKNGDHQISGGGHPFCIQYDFGTTRAESIPGGGVQHHMKMKFPTKSRISEATGKWRMCTNYTNLNKACPKDPYPLPRIDLLMDSTVGCELFSMMDTYQEYHQIFMAEEDRVKTSFITKSGIYCYNVMPFDLKNTGATYQRLVNKMFEDQIGTSMQVYADDMLVKSKKESDHLAHLKQAFEVMRAYGMKLNPTKCMLEVRGGRFLGYMVSERGIETNPKNIKVIMQLKSPRTRKDVQKLTGKIASLSHFISRSANSHSISVTSSSLG